MGCLSGNVYAIICSCCFPHIEEGPVLGGRLFTFLLCVDRVLIGVSSGRCPAGVLCVSVNYSPPLPLLFPGSPVPVAASLAVTWPKRDLCFVIRFCEGFIYYRVDIMHVEIPSNMSSALRAANAEPRLFLANNCATPGCFYYEPQL